MIIIPFFFLHPFDLRHSDNVHRVIVAKKNNVFGVNIIYYYIIEKCKKQLYHFKQNQNLESE